MTADLREEDRRIWAIVSNNCWGASLYAECDLAYNSPFVGLWLPPDDYLALLADFRSLIRQELRFPPPADPQGYPIGLLGGRIRICFQHYATSANAARAWSARAARLPPCDDDLFIKICDRDGFGPAHLARFAALPYRNKVAFLARGKFDVAGCDWAIELESAGGCVPSGLELWERTRAMPGFDARDWVARRG